LEVQHAFYRPKLTSTLIVLNVIKTEFKILILYNKYENALICPPDDILHTI